MTSLPPPNWEDIKTRYVVNHEQPQDIAKDYDVAVGTISNRASEERWREERLNLGRNLREQEIERRKRLLGRTGALIESMVENLEKDMPNMGATIQDGEGLPNKYHSDTWKKLIDFYFDDEKVGQLSVSTDDGKVEIKIVKADKKSE